MTKTASLSTYLLGVGSYFSIFAMFIIAYSVLAPAHADEVKYEPADYASYTPSMAARGQRFYVGP